jgi:thioredoxin 1
MIKITDENYNEIVNNDNLVIIDFYADWCGPCKSVSITLDKIQTENPDVIIGKADVDEVIDASSLNGVRNIPTLLFIKNGVVLSKIVGSTTQSTIQAEINKLK